MGLLVEYFTAPTDEAAASTIDGGPARSGLPVLDEWNIEPSIQMANLEEVLTGRSWKEIAVGGDGVVADRDGGERLVLRLTDTLVDALVSSTPEQLELTAGSWSRAEEFYGQADPEMLTEFLAALSGLAREAGAGGRNVYCWVSV